MGIDLERKMCPTKMDQPTHSCQQLEDELNHFFQWKGKYLYYYDADKDDTCGYPLKYCMFCGEKLLKDEVLKNK